MPKGIKESKVSASEENSQSINNLANTGRKYPVTRVLLLDRELKTSFNVLSPNLSNTTT
ncbi:MAG: hypothetical protein ACE5K4_09500 [Candidatus Hydrothermarchaeota archaeon]